MEHITEILTWVLENFGIGGFITFGFLTFIIMFFYFLAKNPVLIEEASRYFEKRANKLNKKKLRKHQIFRRKKEYLRRIKYIRFPGEYYKTALVKLFLKTKIISDNGMLKAFLNTDKLKKMPKMKLVYYLHELVDDMVKKFDLVIKLELKKFVRTHVRLERPLCTEKEITIFTNKLFEHIMTSDHGWNEKRDARLIRIKAHIDEIPLSIDYTDNFSGVSRLYSILNVATDSETIDAIRTYSRMNGEIEKRFKDFEKGYKLIN